MNVSIAMKIKILGCHDFREDKNRALGASLNAQSKSLGGERERRHFLKGPSRILSFFESKTICKLDLKYDR